MSEQNNPAKLAEKLKSRLITATNGYAAVPVAWLQQVIVHLEQIPEPVTNASLNALDPN